MEKGRKRDLDSRDRSPESTEPGTAIGPMTRSRSRGEPVAVHQSRAASSPEIAPTFPQAAGSGSSPQPQLKMAPTPVQVTMTDVEALGSQSTFSKWHHLSSATSEAGAEEEMSVPASASTATAGEEVDATDSMYVPITPLRRPRYVELDSSGKECRKQSLFPDMESYKAYLDAKTKYSEKIDQLMKFPTLDKDTTIDAQTIEESAADTILKASKFVFGLSAHTDGVVLPKCSGILIEWNGDTGIILTTARIFCLSNPVADVDEWLGREEFNLNVEVHVHMARNTEVKGKLEYFDRNYGFALISAPMGQPTKLACFREDVNIAQRIFVLGRDMWDLDIGDGKVLRKGANIYERHHYLHTDGLISRCGAGGAVIDVEGYVLGMTQCSSTFIPSSIILRCLHLWRTFRCVPRIHLGMKFLGMKCLNLKSKEKISRNYEVDAGLIVVQVAVESKAEQLGVRGGDIILSVNGKDVDSAVELENLLLDVCKDYLEKGIGHNSDVDVMVDLVVLHVKGVLVRNIQLTAKLSHCLEIITEGENRIFGQRPSDDPAPSDDTAPSDGSSKRQPSSKRRPYAKRRPRT